MILRPVFRREAAKIVFFGLLAFALLAIRFSPNWVAFYYGVRDAKVHLSGPAESAAIDKAILSGYSIRGFYVTQLAHNLNTEIDVPTHKMARWRLLVPALGHFLLLPDWLTLGLAHVGCLALVLALVAIGSKQARDGGQQPYEALYFGVVAGASAPFFTSMGLLGNYDSWLALAFIGVAFATSRWLVLLVCILAPWIDERFVIGLPLALAVRRMMSTETAESPWQWFRKQSLIPLLVIAAYSLIRLKLGGSAGSQTVGQYLTQFVFAEPLSVHNRLFGAWEGLRFGWVFVAAAIVWQFQTQRIRPERLLLAVGIAFTGLIGLYVAQDIGRSMVLLISVVPLGWMVLTRKAWWGRFHVGICLAAGALILPAHHVLGKFTLTVDNVWTPSMPLTTAENDIGDTYRDGDGVPKDSAEAVRWYRKAAEHGNSAGQFNLGKMYAHGDGVAKDSAEALKWYLKAARQNLSEAQNNLGIIYARGDGVPKDGPAALEWWKRAAELGNARAQNNLGMNYARGDITPTNLAQAYFWLSIAGANGLEEAKINLATIAKEMTPEKMAEVKKLERENSKKLAPR